MPLQNVHRTNILALFRLLPQAAILDVLNRIALPVYTPLYMYISGLSLPCTLICPSTLPVKILVHNHSILSRIRSKMAAWGNKRKNANTLSKPLNNLTKLNLSVLDVKRL